MLMRLCWRWGLTRTIWQHPIPSKDENTHGSEARLPMEGGHGGLLNTYTSPGLTKCCLAFNIRGETLFQLWESRPTSNRLVTVSASTVG